MNGTNSTQFFTKIRMALLVMVLFTANLTKMEAQGVSSCACKGSIQVSLNENCEATITTLDLLASPTTCGGFNGRLITLMKTKTGGIIVGPTSISVTLQDGGLYVGKTIYGKVSDPNGLNSCWTEIKIEDKMKPSWASNRPDTCIVTCPSLGTFVPRAIDNCHTPRVYQVSENIVVNNCQMPAIFAGPDTLKCITREYRAVDESGNVSDEICKVVIYVTAIDDIIWPKNTQLYCEEDYAKIPSGPFAGNPSPLDIGNKRGSGVPSLYPWLPTIKNGTYWIGRSTDGLRDSVSLATNIVPVGSPASAQVCLTAPSAITLTFRYGSTNLPTSNDSIFYTVNGAWRAGAKGPLVGIAPPPPLPQVALTKGQTICVNLVGSNASLTFGLDTLMTGIPLSPEIVNDCNIFVTYTDQKFPAIKCVTKILRRWTVMEWSCNSSINTYDQLIEIIDNKGPEIKDLRNDVATTGGHACEAFYKLQKPRLVDNCSNDLKYNVTVYDNDDDDDDDDDNGNPILTILGLKVSDADRFVKLPLGCNTITYTSFDDCHNSEEISIEVRVEDNTPPVAVCKQNTVVSLTSTGSAWVPSSSFDNGSYDECDLAKVLVRRMDPATNCTPCKTPILPGFTYVGEYNNPHTGRAHHYYVSKHRATPRVAAKTAAAVGGYLVHLNNGPEKDWVHARYNDWNLAEDYLIGLRDAIGKGQFSWYSGVVGNYRNWEAGFPVDTVINALNLANESIYVRAKYDNSKWINFDEEDCDADEYLYVVEIENPCGFSEYVEFCCADAGQSRVMVVRAIDKSGNWNECMVNAHIQNKIPPRIVCPQNRTISCNDPFDVARLRESFGWPTAEGNCNTVNITTDSTVELTSCRIGSITRRFKAFYPGGTDTARCTQIIMVMGNSNFRPTNFPPNQLIEGCEDPGDDAFSPEVLGKPVITADNSCSLAGFKYEDEVYTFNNSQGEACFKILRKWKVIDWCKFYPNVYLEDGRIVEYPRSNFTINNSDWYADRHLDPRINTWEHIQEIKVVDRVAPVIQCPAAKTVCTYDANCVGGFIELSATASDVCTEQLRWSYRIDANNDGSFESGLSKSGLGNSIDAKGTYPIGTHRIQYVFEDRCGNASTCEQLFTIKNCKAPTPYCLNGLSTTLMPVDTNNNGTPDIGMVSIWASDFDNGSAHVCPRYTVALSFEPITANANGTPRVVNGRTYTCDSIRTSTRKDVRIYVAAIDPNGKVVLDDQNRVVQDYCSTFITVQDNFRVCGTAGRIVVNGSVMTENSVPVKDVSVSLEGSEKTMMTGNNGTYNFADVTSGGSYLVKPFKNDDHINGISTLDLVMIQRHILGIERLNSPYKLIAADVNNDKNISAADLTELRKLILGISDKFNSNNSWRFVDKDHKFTDVNKAQSEIFPELYSLNNVNSNMKIDFLSIKVGDVNGNVKANATDNNTESRSSQDFALNTLNASFVAGQTIEVPVEVTEANSVSGFQFTVAFDAEKVSLEGIDGTIVGMTDNNFGFTHIGDGLLTVSYNKDKAMDMAAGDKIIKLTFKAKANGTVAEVLNINSDITKAEAYTGSLDVMNVKFNVVSRGAESVVLHQNTPNPFKASTVIGFDLPKAMSATITIYDVTGKMLREYKDEYSKGFNSIEINKNELGSVGVMYYTLEAEGFKATKKMVVIE